MTIQSSILVWRILWIEEPGRLQPMGWPRVRHDRNESTRMQCPQPPEKAWGAKRVLCGQHSKRE